MLEATIPCAHTCCSFPSFMLLWVCMTYTPQDAMMWIGVIVFGITLFLMSGTPDDSDDDDYAT